MKNATNINEENETLMKLSFEMEDARQWRDKTTMSRLSSSLNEPFFIRHVRSIRDLRATLPPLHDAVSRGDKTAVRQMMETVKRRHLNNVDANGMTPLHYASKYGHQDIALLLLDNGASIDIKTKQGGALQTAIR